MQFQNESSRSFEAEELFEWTEQQLGLDAHCLKSKTNTIFKFDNIFSCSTKNSQTSEVQTEKNKEISDLRLHQS